ncbi:MAG: hypothetical protein ACM3XR_06115 [Bacillota bacterium]
MDRAACMRVRVKASDENSEQLQRIYLPKEQADTAQIKASCGGMAQDVCPGGLERGTYEEYP